MPDPSERFIAAASAPLADNVELGIAARHQLAESIADLEKESRRCDSLEACAARLEALPVRPSALRRFLLPAMLLLSLPPVGFTAFYFFQHREQVEFFAGKDLLAGLPDSHSESLAPHASSKEKLLLFGDLSKSDPVERIKALWDSEPENPAYFAEYARRHVKERRALPPDFHETAARIDPENGYFFYLEAAAAAQGCVASNPPKAKIKSGVPPPPLIWTIRDQARLDQATELLEQSSSLPEWRSYEDVLYEARFKLLDPPSDNFELTEFAFYIFHHPGPYMEAIAVSNAVAAKAAQCAEQSDRIHFAALESAASTLSIRLAESHAGSAITIMISETTISHMSKSIVAAAEALGIGEEMERLRAREKDLVALRDRRRPTPESSARGKWIESRGAWLMSNNAPIEAFRAPGAAAPDEEALKPGRLADYALIDRTGALCAWAVFGLATLLAWSFRFRGGTLARRVSLPLQNLLRGRDWLWIIGGGVLVPFTALQITAWLTPLGGREWSVTLHGMIVPAGQLGATIVLMLGLPALLADWRLRLRSGRLIQAPRRPWTGLLLITATALAFPLFVIALRISLPDGLSPASSVLMPRFANFHLRDAAETPGTLVLVATGIIALGLCWCLGLGIRALLASGPRMLRRVVLSRVLVSAYTVAMFATAATLPLYHAVEKYWHARDQLVRMSSQRPLNEYERAAVGDYQAQLLKILKTWN